MNKRIKSQKGFTLVEMIVTLVILGILLTVSVSGLMAWQDWSDFNRVNEYAETMFLAAQNQLSEYSANGTLSDFGERVMEASEKGNVLDITTLYYEEGKTYTKEKLQENTVWTTREDGTLVYVKADKGDYNKYIAGDTTASVTAPFVFELLSSYIYDQSLLNETICIEFSLEDGQVFAAFYTDKALEKAGSYYESFEYNNNNKNERGLVNIAKRYESYRKSRMVGYYGVDTLSLALRSKNDKPTINNLMLNNEDTLNLSFAIGKYPNAISQMKYQIEVYDNDMTDSATGEKKPQPVLGITLDAAATPIHNFETRQTVSCPVVRYVYDASGNLTDTQDLGNYEILAYKDEKNKFHIVLDAADVQATTNLYQSELYKLDNANDVKSGYVKFTKSLSFHRFGVDADNIYCTIYGTSDLYKPTTTKQSNIESAFFATAERTKTTKNGFDTLSYSYRLDNCRHLYNIRYIEDLTEEKGKNYLKDSSTWYKDADELKFTYALIDDLDWNQFVEDGSYYNSDDALLIPDATKRCHSLLDVEAGDDNQGKSAADPEAADTFASIKKLRMQDTFVGNEYKVSGLKISQNLNIRSSLYLKEDGSKETDNPVGLFATNNGTIKNAKLDKLHIISGGDKVGGFCGINVCGFLTDGTKLGTLEELAVLNTGIKTDEADDDSVIEGKKHVGGIVGYLQGVEDLKQNGTLVTIKLEKLKNAAKVTGNMYIGGILGEVRIPRKQKVAVEITECENTGAVIGVKGNKNTDAKYIGGITGYAANMYEDHNKQKDVTLLKITKCKSTPEYSAFDLQNMLNTQDIDQAANKLKDKLSGIYVGGIVGFNFYGTIEKCSTETSYGQHAYVFGDQYVGGIVGFNCGPASGIKGGNESDRGINGANVVGREYVGGITGCNADIDREQLIQDAKAIPNADKHIPKDADVHGSINALIHKNQKNVTDTDLQVLLEYLDIVAKPQTDRNMNVKLEQWVNKGIVFAADQYAGGISGFNTGWIYNCDSKVKNSKTSGFFQSTYSGDYAGGIAGYNSGVIGNTNRDKNDNFKVSDNRTGSARRISAICYVTGKNYVGGVVGYNDENAIVEDYAIAGGTIKGTDDSAFVGGYAGFNSSILLLQDESGKARYIESNPNEVKGGYFVGGSIGGNIVNTNGYSGDGKPSDPVVPNPVDPDPIDPDPVDPEPVGNLYTTFELGSGPNINNGIYEVWGNITVHNDSNEQITNWYFVFNGDYEVMDCTNFNYDATTKLMTPRTDYWNQYIYAKGSQSCFVHIKAKSETAYNYLLSHQYKVYSGSPNGLSADQLSLMAAAPDITVDFQKDNSWGNTAIFDFKVNNHTNHDYPLWKIELINDINYTITFCWGGQGSKSGNIFTIIPPTDNSFVVPQNGQLHVRFQLEFANPQDIDKFVSSNHKVYSNGSLIYEGGEGTNPGTPEDNTKKIYTQFKTDNFLGQLKGKAYVGGFVGYNMLINNSNTGYDKGYVYDLQNAIREDINNNKDSFKAQYMLLENVDNKSVKNEKGDKNQKVVSSDVVLHIDGGNNNQTKTNSLGIITANICVGGVVGYNTENTKLYVKNVVNATPITATGYIANADEQPGRTTDYRGKEKTFTYSYAGGIIGKVGRNTIVDACQNTSSGLVSSNGVYNGSLCEVNEGTVKNCKVSVTGSGVSEYVAGICGLNKGTGLIDKCTINKITLSGRNVVGGMAAENFGTINVEAVEDKSPVSNAKMTVSGKPVDRSIDGVAGSVVAYNVGVVNINVSSGFTKPVFENVNIESKGNFVGGIIGINEGFVTNVSNQEIILTGSVLGRECVGGFIGKNNSQMVELGSELAISKYVNKAVVTATQGMAGGIVGENCILVSAASSDVKKVLPIKECKNYGTVNATETGNAGGIVAENSGMIDSCIDYGIVESPNGICGGITAINKKDATVRNCVVRPEKDDSTLSFAALTDVGGICALNEGLITFPRVQNVSVCNYVKSKKSNIGVITGVNKGSIELAPHRNSVVACKARTYTDYSNLGGVTGLNQGTITGNGMDGSPVKPQTIIVCDIGFQQMTSGDSGAAARIANMGGIAGKNEGSIAQCSVDGTIKGNLGSKETGYGGVAGISGSEKDASITQCSFDGNLSGIGSSDYSASTGGIVGRNYTMSTIRNCWVGILDENETIISAGDLSREYFNADYDTVSNSNIGGVAGENYGKIYDCDNHTYSKDTVKIISYAGSSGGIVGKAFKYSVTTGSSLDAILSTGEKWSVEARYPENDNGNGGIIGKCESGEDINYAKNYANVLSFYQETTSKNNTYVAGVVGRLENQYDTNVRYYECENYGYIDSVRGSAGIVANVKFQGITFENCRNYGPIGVAPDDTPGLPKGTSGHVGKSPDVAGGILGVRKLCSYPTRFINCENHGTLESVTYAGGMCGRIDDDAKEAFVFQNCVNTGSYYCCDVNKNKVNGAGNNTGGISGTTKTDATGARYINCRNYGVGFKYGISGNVPTHDANSAPIYMYNCLDLNGSTTYDPVFNPMIATTLAIKDAKNNYYINSKSMNYEPVQFTGNIGTNLTNNRTEATKKPVADFINNNPSDNSNVFFYKNKDLTLTYNFTDYRVSGDSIDGIVLYLSNNNTVDGKNMNYTINATYKEFDTKNTAAPVITASGSYDYLTGRVEIPVPEARNRKNLANVSVKVTNADGVSEIYLKGTSLLVNGQETALNFIPDYDELKSYAPYATKLSVTAGADGGFDIKPYFATNKIHLNHNPAVADYYKDKEEYAKSTVRIPTYEELNPKVLDFIYNMNAIDTKLDTPTSVAMSYINGNNRVTWDKVVDAYDYEISYRLVDKDGNLVLGKDGKPVLKEENVLTGANFYDFPFENDWGMNGYQYAVKVRAVNAYRYLHDGATTYDSDYTEEKTFTAMMVLPTPDAYVEMIGPNKFAAVLRNREDYKLQDGTYIDCEVNISGGGLGLTIPVKTSMYSKGTSSVNSQFQGGNKTIYTYARPTNATKNSYIETPKQGSTVCVIGHANDMHVPEHKNMYTVSFAGFSGVSTDAMSYQVVYSDINPNKVGEGVVTVGSDIVAYDEELGFDVSYAHGETLATFAGNSASVLSNLPDDLVDREKITVYTYPHASQNYVIYYGHTVAENINIMAFEDEDADLQTKEIDGVTYYNIKKLIDEDFILLNTKNVPVDSQQSIWDSDAGALRKGYVVIRNDDGTYTVIYNACLNQETPSQFFGVVKNTFTLKDTPNSDGYRYYDTSHDPGVTYLLQPKPVVEDQDVTIETDAQGTTSYNVKWDQAVDTDDPMYKDAKYTVELVGVTLEEKRVSLAMKTDITGRTTTFVDTNSNWNYPLYEIRVTRVGESETGTNKTIKLPQKTLKEVAVKLRLSATSMPNVEMKQIGDSFDKDHLDYKVTWNAITDEKEIADLGGYLIEARTGTGDSVHVHYYYIVDITNPGTEDDGIGLDFTALEAEGTVTKLTSYVPSSGANADELRSAIIDLSDFDSGDQVAISVQAIARKEARFFKDGLSDGAFLLEIPERISAKGADVLSVTPVVNSNPLTVQQLDEQGMKFVASSFSESGVNGQYQIAVAIYDEIGKNVQESLDFAKTGAVKPVLHVGDEPGDAAGYWNSGAKKTIFAKSDNVEMQGDELSSAVYTLTSSGNIELSEYAGMWMKVAVRRVADNKVSSYWSDEDAEASDTINYLWVQLPSVKLDAPNISTHKLTQYYDGHSNKVVTETPEMTELTMTSRTISYVPSSFDAGYAIEMIDRVSGAPHLVYIEESLDGYNVFYAGDDMSDITYSSSCKQNPYAKLVGQIKPEDSTKHELALPYTKDIYANASVYGGTLHKYTIPAKIIWDDGKLQIVLPDIIELAEGTGNMQNVEDAYSNTTYVSVRVVPTSTDGNYVASDYSSWERDSDNNEVIGNTHGTAAPITGVSMSATSSSVEIDGIGKTQLNYTLHASGADMILCQIVAYDAEGNCVLAGYRSCVMTGSEDSKTGYFSIIKDDWFDDTKVAQVQIRLMPVMNQGVGAMSAASYLTTTELGELVPIAP